MEILESVLRVVVTCLEVFSVIILLLGVILCLKKIFVAVFTRKEPKKQRYIKILHAKIDLGGNVLLGLEILIVADIIKTIVNASLTDVIVLGAIVAIRTVISYFLTKEIEGLDEEIEHEFMGEPGDDDP